MGLDFSKTTTAAAPAATVVPDTKDEIAVVEQYDIVADRDNRHIWSGGCRRNFESIGCRVKQHEYVTA